MTELLLSPSKGTSLRRVMNTAGTAWHSWLQAKGEWHCLGGYNGHRDEQYKHLMSFPIDFTDMASIQSARLHLFTVDDHTGLVTQQITGPNIVATVLTTSFAEDGGGEGGWTGDIPQTLGVNDNYKAYANIKKPDGSLNVINFDKLVRYWAPKTVKVGTLGAGLGITNRGFVLNVAGSAPDVYNHEWCVASENHGNAAVHPVLVINYTPRGGPGQVLNSSPAGDIAADAEEFFTGEYEPGRSEDRLTATSIEVYNGSTKVWASDWVVGSANDTETNTFSVPLPPSLPSRTALDWKAKVRNQRGEETPFSVLTRFTKVSSPPTLVLVGPTGSRETLAGVYFEARYSDPDGNPLHNLQIQVTPTPPVGSPTWEPGTLVWDSGLVQATSAEKESALIRRLYGGDALGPATYSYRVRAEDEFGSTSTWVVGTFILTKGYEPSPGETLLLTGYDRRRQRFRVRIYGMGSLRGPGTLVAEMYDAANVGASEYYNSPGEFFFTLPSDHPQASVIEPYQSHYELALYKGEGWKPISQGLVTDYDATEDESVWYGMDYIGLLSLLSDERFNLANPQLPVEKGGAFYSDDTITQVITDQLDRAKAEANSIVGFIARGDIVSMAEKVSINATFKPRLQFISGLIDSARAGTGKKTRLVCERAANGAFRWRVLGDPGLNRDNLRMEYGSLIQGFQVIPFGEFGTKVHGIGRTTEGLKVYYSKQVAPGISEATYGSIPRINAWNDLDDQNDLTRRTKQAAMGAAKVGKRMALGIRVDALDVKDGWDICDSIPIRIQRGVVDTDRFHPDPNGLSWWTIWGWSWNSYADGHSDLTLSILPREDSYPPDPDLIPSKPIFTLGQQWQVGYGVPTVHGLPPSPTPTP